jgi:N-acetylneuraminate synthase
VGIIRLNNGRLIGDSQPPYIIAEFNSSHNGNIDSAKAMIDSAKKCGCDCVKFQSWSAESLYSKTYYDKNPISKRIVKKFSFSKDVLRELFKYSKYTGIDFSSTPYSNEEVNDLIEFDVPFIKVASMEINNLPYLEYIARTQIPIILSTGMSDIKEVKTAVSVIEKTGNKNLCLFHCISIYPADVTAINLRNILMLREIFPEYVIGFSDHTIGTEIAVASIALGSSVLEKHFTLDKKKIGMDNQMALEPPEMKAMVDGCRNVFSAMGSKERVVTEAELNQRKNMRRSIIAIRDIPKGSKIRVSDLGAKRPGTGVAPNEADKVIGKTATKLIQSDELISVEDIK